ncbi:hypothetical protein EUS_05710 [[Eubacterium] siraeum 70/3]|uniref:Uncharacterized protein n=1 Tax=[Eubacterium] siraeum 70/3 TaxID=657319 RepID=D4JRY8_9FIRM|nr:hypothetical protein EUS_05710 [[Eubacterium] siraeum 70/3]
MTLYGVINLSVIFVQRERICIAVYHAFCFA